MATRAGCTTCGRRGPRDLRFGRDVEEVVATELADDEKHSVAQAYLAAAGRDETRARLAWAADGASEEDAWLGASSVPMFRLIEQAGAPRPTRAPGRGSGRRSARSRTAARHSCQPTRTTRSKRLPGRIDQRPMRMPSTTSARSWQAMSATSWPRRGQALALLVEDPRVAGCYESDVRWRTLCLGTIESVPPGS